MIKLKRITTLFIVFLLVMSCKTNKYSFLSAYPTKDTPIIDSTSFSNHVEGKLLAKEEQKALGLHTVLEGQLEPENAKIGVSYLPKISDNFTSVVYYFYASNTELTSILVNYDENYKIINSQMVAYDEIAEGLLSSTATIYKDKIILKEYISDSASTIKFNISEKGDITRE